MSKDKHTPGPWVWRGKDGGLYQEGTTHRFGEAVLVPSYEYDSGVDTIVSEPDMALIAAAPDLLAALKTLADTVEQAWPALKHQGPLLAARAAISKATLTAGEQVGVE